MADTVEKDFLERATSIQETVHSDSIVARSGAGRARSRDQVALMVLGAET